MNNNLLELCNYLDLITVNALKESSNLRILPKVILAIEAGNKEGNLYHFSWIEAQRVAMNIKFDLSNELTDAELDILAEKISQVVHNTTIALTETFAFMPFDSIIKKLEGMTITVH